MYGILCAERDSGAAPSRMNAVLEACVFARDVLGVAQLEPIIKSRRCSGTATANIHNTIKQSTPLIVEQFKKLHDVLSNDVEDWNKAFAGMTLFCVYARSRWMDPQHSDKFCTASLHPDKLYDQQIGWLLLSNWLNDFNSSGHFALAFGDALAFFFGLGFGFGSASFLSAVNPPVSWDFATPFGNGSKCKVTRGSYVHVLYVLPVLYVLHVLYVLRPAVHNRQYSNFYHPDFLLSLFLLFFIIIIFSYPYYLINLNINNIIFPYFR